VFISLTAYTPEVIEHPKSISAGIYTSVTFQCRAKPYGNVQIQWKKLKSFKLPEASTTFTNRSQDGVTSVLKIDKIIHHYKGYYYCVVKNKIGEVNSSVAQLHVDGMCCTKSQYINNKAKPGWETFIPFN